MKRSSSLTALLISGILGFAVASVSAQCCSRSWEDPYKDVPEAERTVKFTEAMTKLNARWIAVGKAVEKQQKEPTDDALSALWWAWQEILKGFAYHPPATLSDETMWKESVPLVNMFLQRAGYFIREEKNWKVGAAALADFREAFYDLRLANKALTTSDRLFALTKDVAELEMLAKSGNRVKVNEKVADLQQTLTDVQAAPPPPCAGGKEKSYADRLTDCVAASEELAKAASGSTKLDPLVVKLKSAIEALTRDFAVDLI